MHDYTANYAALAANGNWALLRNRSANFTTKKVWFAVMERQKIDFADGSI